ncbi:MAG: AgmX/PglI C-terminal domain-containing protein [Deltaproteobacteria bacterium]|nr:AgmX/PglI C-terminal domain-containing protein [Deltaproteobacteria bacterium]
MSSTTEHDATGGELVFQASPALKALNIARPQSAAAPTPRQTVATAELPRATAPQKASLRWPVAFVLAAAIGTGGYLYNAQSHRQSTLASTAAAVATAADPAMTDPAATGQASGDPAGATAKAAGPAATTDPGKAATDDNGSANKAGADTPDTATSKTADAPEATAKSRRNGRKRKGAKVAAKTPVASPAATAAPAAAPTATKDKPTAKRGGDALDSLIDDALGDSPKPKKAAKPAAATKASADDDLPQSLTMNQIRAGMHKILPLIQGCYDKYQVEGRATVKTAINKSGTVDSASVKGKFFGTDTGTCVINAVKKAHFPRFKGDAITITYPFMLR